MRVRLVPTWIVCCSLSLVANAADPPKLDTSRGDRMIAEYFRLETTKLRDACLADIHSADDWNAKKGEYRRQLLDMLGLDPLPERTDLQPVVTGTTEHDIYSPENDAWQFPQAVAERLQWEKRFQLR